MRKIIDRVRSVDWLNVALSVLEKTKAAYQRVQPKDPFDFTDWKVYASTALQVFIAGALLLFSFKIFAIAAQ